MKRTAGIRFAAIIFLLCCMIACSGASAETTQEENNMTDYDFTAFTNVEITGIDLDSLTKEELSVLYQAARYCQAMTDKDIDTMLDILLRPNDTVVVTVPHSDRASDPQLLAGKVAAHVQHVEAIADNDEAMNRALELANGEKLLVMAGSLYLVGELRKMLLDKKGGEA